VGGWAPGTFSVTDHAKGSYPLAGRHATVPCSSCHLAGDAAPAGKNLGRARVDLRPLHDRCTACHAPTHGSQLDTSAESGACDRCHGVDAWRPSTFTLAEHAETDFPLIGAHVSLPCARCHGPERPGLHSLSGRSDLGKAKIVFAGLELRCGECHGDPHAGRYTGEGPLTAECDLCHGSTRFRPSRVDPELHERFPFRLRGAHRATPCVFCHSELTAEPVERKTLVLDHDPQLVVDLSRLPTACEACHTQGVPR
jgi:hypothetical protein